MFINNPSLCVHIYIIIYIYIFIRGHNNIIIIILIPLYIIPLPSPLPLPLNFDPLPLNFVRFQGSPGTSVLDEAWNQSTAGLLERKRGEGRRAGRWWEDNYDFYVGKTMPGCPPMWECFIVFYSIYFWWWLGAGLFFSPHYCHNTHRITIMISQLYYSKGVDYCNWVLVGLWLVNVD